MNMAKSNKSLAKFNKQTDIISAKKTVVFDLDGTLTESKANLDKEMASLLCQLLKKKTVAVIGGGNYPQFEKQFLAYLQCSETRFKNLFILPTSGGRMYKYNARKWQLVYKNILTTKEKKRVLDAFKR